MIDKLAKIRQLYQFTLRLVIGSFFVLLSYLVVASTLMPRYGSYNNTMLLDTLTGIVVLLLVLRFRKHLSRVLQNVYSNRLLPILAFIGISGFAIFSWSLSIDPGISGWDPLTLHQTAVNLVTEPDPFMNHIGYFQIFSNNVAILGLVAGWFNIFQSLGGHDLLTASFVLNFFIVSITLIMTYLLSKELLGKKAALVAASLCFMLLALSPWSRTLYTDTVGSLFPVTLLYFIVRLRRAKTTQRTLFIVTSLGVIGSLGYAIKPTTVFVLAGAMIVLAPQFINYVRKRKNIRFSLIAAALFLTTTMGTTLAIRSTMQDVLNVPLHTMPLSHFALLGLSRTCNQEECRYGAWNMADAVKQGEFSDFESYEVYVKKEIGQRLHYYGTGGYTQFLTEKGSWIIGDGNFYAYSEGVEAEAPLVHRGTVFSKIQSVAHPDGKWYLWYANIRQVIWILVLLAILAPFWFLKQVRYPPEIQIALISLLGLLSFLLMFEARSRYLFLYIPIFAIIATHGMRILAQKSKL